MINSVAAIIVDNKNRFLLQLRDEKAPLYANKWTLFSGTMKKGETPINTLKRELKEELNTNITQGEYYKTYRKHLVFKVHVFVIHQKIKEPIKVTEGKAGKYIKETDFAKLEMANYTRKILEDFLQNTKF